MSINIKSFIRTAFANKATLRQHFALFKSYATQQEAIELANQLKNTTHPFHHFLWGHYKINRLESLGTNNNFRQLDTLER
ncbi:MAG: hypothetical protein HUU02_10225, partial [Bacteroidetes bacterium]|nr:hypothetical protein [Bacteroidota bacterium]